MLKNLGFGAYALKKDNKIEEGFGTEPLILQKIIDFTSLLKENEMYTIFNPCITHYKDNLYLCSYRVYSRGIPVDGYIETASDVYGNPNHPWRSKWGGEMNIDKPKKGKKDFKLDLTKFAMLKIEKDGDWKIELVKDYKETFNDIIPLNPEERYVDGLKILGTSGDIIKDPEFYKEFQYLFWQDTRVNPSPVEGLYFLTGNLGIKTSSKLFRKNQDSLYSKSIGTCNKKSASQSDEYEMTSLVDDGGCYLLWMSVIAIDPITLKIRNVHDPIILCPQFSARIEKNWSLYSTPTDKDNIKIFITYQIRDKFRGTELYSLDYTLSKNKFGTCQHLTQTPKKGEYVSNTENKNEMIQEKRLSFYNLIETAYNHKLHISSTTPTIPYNCDELIAVGHVKWEWKYFEKKEWEGTKLYNFNKELKKRVKNFHYAFVYLMFFYTLDKETLKLKRTSDFFLPQPADISLVFPVGITKLNNTDSYLVSYGNYDTTTEALFVSHTEIENSLKNINRLPFVRDMKIKFIGKGKEPKIENEKELIEVIREYPLFQITGWKEGEVDKVIYR